VQASLEWLITLGNFGTVYRRVWKAMVLKFSGLTVSKNYRWHEEDCEFRDIRTDVRRSDSLYEAKLDIYEDRVHTWFLGPAEGLLRQPNFAGDYVALCIALAYIEGVEQYRRGKDPSVGEAGQWFRTSARRIFAGASKKAVGKLWESARCGLFHSGFTTGPVYLSYDRAEALEISHDGKLRINPEVFLQLVVQDFKAYVRELRKNPTAQPRNDL
jgi:hypothetical protein